MTYWGNAGDSCGDSRGQEARQGMAVRQRRLSWLLAGVAPVLLSPGALAQTAGDLEVASEADAPAIVVTGSRIANPGFESSTPVAVVSSDDIVRSGSVNVERALAQIPSMVGAGANGENSNSAGAATINLRGFGANRSLVLVNGRRFAIYDASLTTDLNTIPAALIERVEIVTGGASAVYGSDAITGVANFILRDDFEGIEASAQVNIDEPTTTPVYDFNLTFGGNFAEGRGNLAVSLNYLDRGAISRAQRGEWAEITFLDGCIVAGSGNQWKLGTPLAVPAGQTCAGIGGEQGFISGGSSDIVNGRYFGIPAYGGSNAALNAAYDAAGLTGLGTRGFTFDDAGTVARPALSPQDDYNTQPANLIRSPLQRKMINAFGRYEFSPAATAYFEAHASRNVVSAQLAPNNAAGPLLYNVNNPYLSAPMREVLRQLDLAEQDTTTVSAGSDVYTTTPGDGLAVISTGRRYIEVGPRVSTNETTTYRALFGLRGELGNVSESVLTDLQYDVYYSYAQADNVSAQTNRISRSQLQASVLSANGADPLCNIFGQNLSPDCVSAIKYDGISTTKAVQQVALASLTGNLVELPAGSLGFSLGAEWRKSSASLRPDPVAATGDIAGLAANIPIDGSIEAKEIFGEVSVPLLEDLPLISRLAVNGGFRMSDYSLERVGTVWTYLGGAEWEVVRGATLRAQYQRSIRAPSVQELYQGRVISGGNTLNDPCGSRSQPSQRTSDVRALCIATGVPASVVFTDAVQPSQLLSTETGGNTNLDVETSNTYAVGLVLTPQLISRLYFSVDYFDIDLKGAIAPLGGGAQNTLNLCYYNIQDISSEFCQALHRNPQTGELNDPYVIEIPAANTGSRRTSGIDFGLRYSLPLAFAPFGNEGSTLSLSSNYTWLRKMTIVPVAALPDLVNHCEGTYGPVCSGPFNRWRGTTRVTWSIADLNVGLTHRYYGPVFIDTYLVPLRQGATPPDLETITNPRLGDQHYFDLSVRYDFDERFRLTAGVNNLFDNDPPLGSGGETGLARTTYDVLGRQFFASLRMRL